MKKRIWKFEIKPYDLAVKIPKGAEILTVQTQNGNPYIWALVCPENEKEERYFEIYATGDEIQSDGGINRKYINTFQLESGSLVFHLFERIEYTVYGYEALTVIPSK